MDWNKIKTEAKEKMKDKTWDIWKPTLLIGLISAIISAISIKIFGPKSPYNTVVTSLFSLLLVPAEVGYVSYMLKIVRGEEYDLSELKVFYNKISTLIVINLIVTVFVIFGMVALIIPGIILAIGYSMVYYIFVDNPEIEPMQCLNESKEMMNGYKLDYLGFSLSFFGWILLCVFIIPIIWVIPYITTAQTIYYEELKKLKAQEN